MQNVWVLASLWVGLALIATLLAIWFKISTALSEIVVGTVAQLIIGAIVAMPSKYLLTPDYGTGFRLGSESEYEDEVPDDRASSQRSGSQSGNGALLRAAGSAAKAATERVRLSPVPIGCGATAEIYPSRSGNRVLSQGNSGAAIASSITHDNK